MNYENQPCPGCGHHMYEEDDIVVCPVCATPQHRSCWLENGKCVNDEKHAEGFEWKPSVNTTEEKSPQIIKCHVCGSENIVGVDNCMSCGAVLNKIEYNENVHQEYGSKSCQSCGTENDYDAIHCKRCGLPLQAERKFEPIQNPFVAQTGMDHSEQIGEYTVDDFSLYTKNTAHTYVPKFKRIAEGKKVGFNIWSFLVGPYWFFYKKMYKVGIIAILLFSVVSLVFSSGIEKCQDIILPYEDQIVNKTIAQEEMYTLTEQMIERSGKTFLVAAGLNVILRIVFAVIADSLYYNKIVSDFKVINERVQEDNFKKVVISKRGGSSVLSLISGYFLSQCILSLMAYAAEWMAKM